MSAIIQSFKIRTKLLLLVFPLMVALCLLSLLMVQDYWTDKNQYEASAEVVSEVAVLGQLVHQLQSERGMSAGYLASGGSESTAKTLKEQRVKTDEKLALAGNTVHRLSAGTSAQSAASPQTVNKLSELRDALTSQRQAIDAKSVSGGAAIKWYSDRINSLIDTVYSSVPMFPTVDFAQKIRAYAYLVMY